MIYLCRHGQTFANTSGRLQGRNDTPLTEVGRRQSESTANFLNRQALEAIFASPLKRVSAITARLSTSWISLPELVELDFGRASGEFSEGARERWGLVTDRSDTRFFTQRWPDGESYQDLSRRLEDVVCKLSLLTGNGAVIAHQTVVAVLATKLIGLPIEDYQSFKISNDEYLELEGDKIERLQIVGAD